MKRNQPLGSHSLGDAIMDSYLAWRDESAWVDLAYRAWMHAPADQRADSFRDYTRALDREERAAAEYQLLLEQSAQP